MIETRQQLVANFRTRARAFLAEPNLVNGVDFDDAVVTLKRYVLSVLHDETLASTLARFQKLVRAGDVAALEVLVAQVEEALSD